MIRANSLRALLIIACCLFSSRLMAVIALSHVQVADVTPSGFSVLWHASEASEPRIEIYSDINAINNITDNFEVQAFPLQAPDAQVSDAYAQRLAKAAFINAVQSQGLMKINVQGLQPNQSYYFRVYSESETDSGVWPEQGASLLITQDQNAFLSSAPQLLMNFNSSNAQGWQVMVSAANTPYPVSAFVGDGAANNQAIVNLANLFADTGFNWSETGTQTLTINILNADGELSTQLLDLNQDTNFSVASIISTDFAGGFDGVLTLTSPANNVYTRGAAVELAWTDEASDSALISLFYDNDNQGADGTLIVADLPEDPDGSDDSFTWDITSISDGRYFIYGNLSNGSELVSAYAPGQVTIDVNGLDGDGDGMSDLWELHFFATLDRDGSGDLDQDNISDLHEFLNGTDPATFTNSSGPSVPVIEAPLFATEVASLQPSLVVRNSTIDPVVPLSYDFEVYSDSALTNLISSANQLNEQSGDTTAYTLPLTLTENTRYYWRARAFGSGLFSQWVNGEFFVNSIEEVPAAFNISAPANGAEVDSFTPTLSITNSTDPDNDPLTYQFEIFADSGLSSSIASSANIAADASGTTSWQSDVQLQENTVYYWRATASDDTGLSTTTDTVSFFVNTFNDTPSLPGINSPTDASEVATNSVDLIVNNASDLDNNALVYEFELDTVISFDSASVQRSGTINEGVATTLWNVSGLQEDTTYFWRARASDGNSSSDWVQASFTVNSNNTAPPVPTIDNPGDGAWVATLTPTLSVMPVVDPDGDPVTYRFQLYADPELSNLLEEFTTADTQWLLTNPLSNNTWYYWRARSEDDNGANSDWAMSYSFFVDDNGIDDVPTLEFLEPINNISIDSGSVTARWNDIDPDSSATIALYYDDNDNGADGTLIVSDIAEDADGAEDTFIWDVSAIANGNYYLYAIISDIVNSSTVYAPAQITVNNPTVDIAPVIAITAPANNIVVTQGDAVTLAWSDDDPDSNATIALYYDTDNSGADGVLIIDSLSEDDTLDSFSWNTASTAAGTYYIYAIIADSSNSSTVYSNANITIDNPNVDQAPLIDITEPASNITVANGASVTISWNDIDPDSNASIALYYDIDNTGADGTLIVSGLEEDSETDSYLWDTTGIADGTYFVYAIIDDTNNSSTDYAAGSITVETAIINQPPTINLTSPASNINSDGSAPVLISWTDADPDDNANIALYYDVDSSGADGTLIIEGINEDDATDSFNWNLSGLADGQYFVYAIISDGSESAISYAAGSVNLDTTVANQAPSIEIQSPATDATVTVGDIVNISWIDADPDSNANISLYYDTDNAGEDGVLIVADLAEDDDGSADSFAWNTGSLAEDTYYIYAVITDGEFSASDYSLGAITVESSNAGGLVELSESEVSLTRNGSFTDRRTGNITDRYILTNVGDSTINGPLTIEVIITPAGVTSLDNASGSSDAGNGTIVLDNVELLPGATINYELVFRGSGRRSTGRFTYTQSVFREQ